MMSAVGDGKSISMSGLQANEPGRAAVIDAVTGILLGRAHAIGRKRIAVRTGLEIDLNGSDFLDSRLLGFEVTVGFEGLTASQARW